MTTQKREAKRKFTIAPQPDAQKSAVEATAPADAPEIVESVEVESLEFVEIVLEEAASPALEEPQALIASLVEPVHATETAQTTKAIFAWTTMWPGKSFDLWNENATAFMEFAGALSKAKDLGEVVALQSQFFADRLGTYARLSKEIGSSAPKGFFAIG